MTLRRCVSCGQLTCASVLRSSSYAAWFYSSLESTVQLGSAGRCDLPCHKGEPYLFSSRSKVENFAKQKEVGKISGQLCSEIILPHVRADCRGGSRSSRNISTAI